MDEELGGVNPNSFFEQITEVRGVAETAQKTSNSNLSLLNELREKVEIISNDLRMLRGETDAAKDKAFEEEDKKQKEEMQARAKAKGEKTQEAVVGDKGGSEGGKKGGGGGVLGFISSFIGGLVGGVTGLAIQGIGGIIGLGTGIIKKGANLGKSLMKGLAGLFGKKKKKKKGEGESKPAVSPDKLLNTNIDEDEDEEKDSEKLTTVREKGKVVGGNVSQEKSDLMKRQIDLEEEMSDAIESNDMKLYEKLEKESEEIDKKLFNLEKSPQSKKKKDKRGILGMIGGTIDAITGNLTDFDKRGGKTFGATRVATGMADFFTADMFDLDKRGKMDLFGMRKKMENKRKREAFENNPEVKNFRNQTENLKDQAKGFPVNTTVNPDGSITSKFGGIRVGGEPVVGDTLSLKQRMAIKAKIQMGNKIEGIEKELYEKSGGGNFSKAEEKELMELYGLKEGEKDPFDFYGDNNSEDAFGFNQGGLVQGYNQGGEVDSVPAMLTPGEFVVSKDAVKKVGVDTLKGLNASVGATNKPTYTMGYRRGEITPTQLVVSSTKFIDQKTQKRMSGQGGRALGSTTKRQGGDTIESKNLFGENYAGISQRTTTSSLDYIPGGDGVRDSNLKTKTIMEEDIVSVAVEDIMEHQDDLLKRIRRVKGYENVTIEDVLNSRVDMDKQKYARIIGHSDAAKATQKKKGEARKLDKEKYGDGYYNYVLEGFNQGGLVGGYNQGGLVGSSITPIIESKNESGEMELIQNLSQSVDSNRQTIQLIGEQSPAMNLPNAQPSPVGLADTPQTSPAEIKDTDAPIPFAMLLRQNAQRYLNLGNNAMVIS